MVKRTNTTTPQPTFKDTIRFELDKFDTDSELKDLVQRISNSRKCFIVTGAGISVASGIADFRSEDGLFAKIQKQYPKKFSSGKDLFDSNIVFSSKTNTELFYEFMNQLYESCEHATPSTTHTMIAKMEARRTLARCYTQNIDCLETKAGSSVNNFFRNVKHAIPKLKPALSVPISCSGISDPSDPSGPFTNCKPPKKSQTLKNKVVQLHGSVNVSVCTLCSSSYKRDPVHSLPHSLPRNPPSHRVSTRLSNKAQSNMSPATSPVAFGSPCPNCCLRAEARVTQGRRPIPVGTLRPAVVLYNEYHMYSDLISDFLAADTNPTKKTSQPDLLLVLGSAMLLPGCINLVRQLANVVHNKDVPGLVVVVNRDSVSHRINSAINRRSAGKKQTYKLPFVDYEILGDVNKFSSLVMGGWRTQTSLKQYATVIKNSTHPIDDKTMALKRKRASLVDESAISSRPTIKKATIQIKKAKINQTETSRVHIPVPQTEACKNGTCMKHGNLLKA
ncbi:hypothetical protein BB560_003383 [Smittium megazygosporum]|uniref:Deacetylase sirtuin-type domain-containing protein n=1 Tax=Smittium megazygosporum TaxID=133381 RepID=A0A2T9YVQ2_9FUNG|nr:hypothetical protein BB560_005810 [Smittium megazygosporum]PVV02170.1 hypothetical protein BB560_003383 [Smittium megazygosporum]